MAVTIDGDEYLTAKEIAAMKGVGVDTVHKAIQSGALTARPFLQYNLVSRAQADAFQPRGRGGARPGAGRKRRQGQEQSADAVPEAGNDEKPAATDAEANGQRADVEEDEPA